MYKQEGINANLEIRKHQERSGLEKENEIALKVFDFEVLVEFLGSER